MVLGCWDLVGSGPWPLIWCRGPESNWLRPPFQGGALPVSYPGTLESVNFRGARKLCQIARAELAVRRGTKTKSFTDVSKRAASAKEGSASSRVASVNTSNKLTVLTI